VPKVVVRRYTGDYALDGDDLYLTANYKQTGERSTFGLSAALSRDSTAASDFVATGFVEKNLPRRSATVVASGSGNLSQRMLLSGTVSYDNVVFVDGQQYGLLDYDYASAQAYAQYALSERTRLQVIPRLAWFRAPQTGEDSREVTLGFGVERDWSDLWRSSVSIGPTYLETSAGLDAIGMSYVASLNGAWERTQLAFSARRLLSPTAARGQLESTDAFDVSCARRLGERLTVSVVAAKSFYSDAADPRNKGGQSRSYGSAYAELAWQASQQWSWQLRASQVRRDEYGSVGEGNSLSLRASWSGLPKTMSR
jgi:hypothetical protein